MPFDLDLYQIFLNNRSTRYIYSIELRNGTKATGVPVAFSTTNPTDPEALFCLYLESGRKMNLLWEDLVRAKKQEDPSLQNPSGSATSGESNLDA